MDIAVIGGGPAGFMAAIAAAENYKGEDLSVVIFEKKQPLQTLLPTGNGRCNITNNIPSYKELSLNYPRGEKFLYSVFSRFGVKETIYWFESNGLRLYTQDDNRMFPVSDSAESVRNLLIEKAKKLKITIKNETSVNKIDKFNQQYKITLSNKTYLFDKVIISTGGNVKDLSSNGYELVKPFDINSTERRASLVGLKIKENYLNKLSGVSIKDCNVTAYYENKKIFNLAGDFLFTHKGVSGPLIFKISSNSAFINYNCDKPLVLSINFTKFKSNDLFDKELINILNENKNIAVSNVLKKFLPKSLAIELLIQNEISSEKKSSEVTKIERKKIVNFLTELKINVISTFPDGEMVTAGGIDLKQINSKTLAAKNDENVFFCGEVLDIDGYTGGFNLQACWSTGYIAGMSAILV